MHLLLKQIFERLAGIHRPAVARSFRGNLGGLQIRGGRRILFYGGPELIERAIVLSILGRNSRRDRLCAFKLRAGIEKTALLATVQFEIALRTLPVRVESGDQHRTTIRATRSRDRPHHAWRTWTQMIRRSAWSALRRFAFSISLLVLFLFFGITIAAVTVLAIHKRLRPSAAPDCNCKLNHDWANTCLFPEMYPIGTLRPAHQSSPLKLFWNAALREQKMGHLCL